MIAVAFLLGLMALLGLIAMAAAGFQAALAMLLVGVFLVAMIAAGGAIRRS